MLLFFIGEESCNAAVKQLPAYNTHTIDTRYMQIYVPQNIHKIFNEI